MLFAIMRAVKTPAQTWEPMLKKLAEFKKAKGHCSVPTNFRENPTLGRWVAAQRHRRKIGTLSASQIDALDRLGFIWSPTDASWESLFAQLAAFKKKHGQCDVPTKWAHNVALADWVQRQRLAKRKGRLGAARARRLNSLGFTWAIYKDGKETSTRYGIKPAVDAAVRPREERLYCLRSGMYVQHDGGRKMPALLQSFLAASRGEMPPYIPLPTRPVVFVVGEGVETRRKLRWKGKGPMPREVMAYVSEQGHLPAYD